MMKQIQYSSFGQPSAVAKCVDVPELSPPTAWEVIVDIEAFPINPADLAMLSGRYGVLPKLPSPIGMEAVGRISALGSAVKSASIGDRVVLLANNNWAERRKVPFAAVHPVPSDLDVRQMAMLKVNPATAFLFLKNIAKLERDDWIIQTAPLSSVGRCMIQIARSLGIRTINVVRRAEAKLEVTALGGDVAILDGPDLAKNVRSAIGHQPLRYAFDAVAGEGTQRLAEALSEGGTVVNYGMLSGEPCTISADQTIFRGIHLYGFWVSKYLNRMSLNDRTELFNNVLDYFQRSSLHIEIEATFPFERFQEAIARAEQSNRRGKVLVMVREHHVESA